MNKIGICFSSKDFTIMPFIELKNYLLSLKKAGITSLDFYTELFLDVTPKIGELAKFIIENDIKITFHYYSSININSIENENDYDKFLDVCVKELSIVRKNLEELNINYQTSIVFHAFDYTDEIGKYSHEKELIRIFSTLCEYGLKLKFEILLETLSYNHPTGKHIGDDISEIETFINRINYDDFGICWDIGHTRLNNIERKTNLYLPSNIMNKVKFIHVHNIELKANQKNYVDHLPLASLQLQDDELEYLVRNGYEGIYSIETPTENLRDKIDVYIECIKKLKIFLENIKED